jgi:hypothetical protein
MDFSIGLNPTVTPTTAMAAFPKARQRRSRDAY